MKTAIPRATPGRAPTLSYQAPSNGWMDQSRRFLISIAPIRIVGTTGGCSRSDSVCRRSTLSPLVSARSEFGHFGTVTAYIALPQSGRSTLDLSGGKVIRLQPIAS